MQINGVELPKYRCHKIVQALQIASLDYDGIGGAKISPVESGYSPFLASPEFMRRHTPEVGGFIVWYEDGYRSFSPSAAFEAGYSLVEDL